MANDVTINVKAKDDASKSLGVIGARAKTSGGLMAGAFTKVHAATALAAVGAMKVGQALFRVGGMAAQGVGYAIGKASDLNETVNKSSVIFGKSQKDIASWASQSSWNLGLSKQAAMESAASFGDMFLQLGFARKSATDMSMSVVKLAADLGSFNNLPTADVQERIAAAFRGEYDSLQALVPTINAAAVQQRAMADTGKKNAEKLTQQEKAAATLAIVMDSTKRAQGDFAKTSDGLANSLKITKARLEDMAASAGKVLLPFAQAGMKGFNHFLDRLEGSKSLKKSLRGLADSLGDFVTSGGNATSTADSLADSFIDLADSADQSFKGFNKANRKFAAGTQSQRAAILKWRITMLEGIVSVADAWAKLNPRMKKVATYLHGVLDRARADFNQTTDEINKKKIVAKLRADKTDAQNKIKDINQQLTKTHNKKTISKLKAEKKQAEAAIHTINSQLNALNGKTATTHIKTIYSKINAKNAGAPFHAAGGIIGGLGANHAAEGGPRGGRVWVGEQGPELVDLPFGSRVHSNADSQKMGDSGGPITLILDLGKGITQRLEIHDRDIRRAVAMGAR